MKILFYQPISMFYEHVGLLIDEAIKLHKEGHEILYVYNNCSNIRCSGNPTGDSLFCAICKRNMHNILKLIPREIKTLNINDLWIQKEYVKYNYNNVHELKKVTYKDVKVGYSVMSSYISATRILAPKINKETKPYFDERIAFSCQLSDVLEKIILEYKPDQICSFNARWIEQRPPYDLACKYKIDFVSYELEGGWGDDFYKTHFNNSTPHNVSTLHARCEAYWRDVDLPIDEKQRLGKEFFEKKRKGVAVGDKVYVNGQQFGKLPASWNTAKENIVIFNSSEDEFSSLGDEFERYALFTSQFQGIRFIAESLKNDENIHVWLRIHPNLADIPYRYHTELFKLSELYPNLTVIAGNDKVSSYTLVDNADKIVVFGSTIGMEAAYRHKPVILLAGSIYYYTEICYIPKSEAELLQLLKTKDLSAKNAENAIKVGFYINYRNPDNKYTYLDFNYATVKFLHKTCRQIRYLKLLGSYKLYAIWYQIICRKIIKTLMGKKRAILDIPYEEDMELEL